MTLKAEKGINVNDAEEAPFWVGIRQIYEDQIWGYQSSGEVLGPNVSFLSWKNASERDFKCAGLKGNVLIKLPCESLASYACEKGEYLKIEM